MCIFIFIFITFRRFSFTLTLKHTEAFKNLNQTLKL